MNPYDIIQQVMQHGLVGAVIAGWTSVIAAVIYVLKRLDDQKTISKWTRRAIAALAVLTVGLTALQVLRPAPPSGPVHTPPAAVAGAASSPPKTETAKAQAPDLRLASGGAAAAAPVYKAHTASTAGRPAANPPPAPTSGNCQDTLQTYLDGLGNTRWRHVTVCDGR